MNHKYQARVDQADDFVCLKISGILDEDNDLGGLAKHLAGPLVIDTADVERINSCGVRDWVNWLQHAPKGRTQVLLVACSPAIVAQVNLVHNFTGEAMVKSFYAPYFCPKCDIEKVLLVETRDIVRRQPIAAPLCRCDDCDGPMDFDDIEDSYFAFLSNAKKVITQSDPLVSSYDAFVSGASAKDRAARIKRPVSSPGSSSGRRAARGSSAPSSRSAGASSPGASDPGSLPSVPSVGSSAQVVSVEEEWTQSDSSERKFGGDEAAVHTVAVRRLGETNMVWVAIALLALAGAALLGYMIF